MQVSVLSSSFETDLQDSTSYDPSQVHPHINSHARPTNFGGVLQLTSASFRAAFPFISLRQRGYNFSSTIASISSDHRSIWGSSDSFLFLHQPLKGFVFVLLDLLLFVLKQFRVILDPELLGFPYSL